MFFLWTDFLTAQTLKLQAVFLIAPKWVVVQWLHQLLFLFVIFNFAYLIKVLDNDKVKMGSTV